MKSILRHKADKSEMINIMIWQTNALTFPLQSCNNIFWTTSYFSYNLLITATNNYSSNYKWLYMGRVIWLLLFFPSCLAIVDFSLRVDNVFVAGGQHSNKICVFVIFFWKFCFCTYLNSLLCFCWFYRKSVIRERREEAVIFWRLHIEVFWSLCLVYFHFIIFLLKYRYFFPNFSLFSLNLSFQKIKFLVWKGAGFFFVVKELDLSGLILIIIYHPPPSSILHLWTCYSILLLQFAWITFESLCSSSISTTQSEHNLFLSKHNMEN